MEQGFVDMDFEQNDFDIDCSDYSYKDYKKIDSFISPLYMYMSKIYICGLFFAIMVKLIAFQTR